MIQKIIPIAASITLIGSASLTAYADNMLDKDYIVREIWSDCWNGKWLMSDDNGNVIDSFMPFSTLTEDTAEEIVIQLSLTMEKVLLTVSEKI